MNGIRMTLLLLGLGACAYAGAGYAVSELDQRPVRAEAGRCPAEPESDFGSGWQYVWVDFTLDAHGFVDAVQVRRGPGISPEEAAAAEDAMRSCRYRPGMVGGEAVPVQGLTRRVRVERSAPRPFVPVDTISPNR
jgi:hypothetical protein